jgi:hypothetical protein
MTAITNIKMKKLTRVVLSLVIMVIIVPLGFASKGGGDKKNSAAILRSTFTPIRISNGFTIKTGPQFTGTHIFNQEKTHGAFTMNSVVTYQRGNTIFILPYKYKVTLPSFNTTNKNNLQLLDFKIKMHK